jgi:hypothetical protein
LAKSADRLAVIGVTPGFFFLNAAIAVTTAACTESNPIQANLVMINPYISVV